MRTINIILPKGKGIYSELINKYEKLGFKGLEVKFINEKSMKELIYHIQNLINEKDIAIEDKLWLIKQYLNRIFIEKFES